MEPRPSEIRSGHLKRRAVVYTRKSSDRYVSQPPVVAAPLRAVLIEWGWPESMVKVHEDAGRSAVAHGARPAFGAMLGDMAAGVVGIVAVADYARLTRNMSDLLAFLRIARRHDVLLVIGGSIVDLWTLTGALPEREGEER